MSEPAGAARDTRASGNAPARPRRASSALKLALLVLAAGIAWRIALAYAIVPAWEARSNLAPCPDRYPLLAQSLLDRHELGFGPGGANPTTVRGPGFPTWLAAGIALGGDDPRWLGLWSGLPSIALAFLMVLACVPRFGAGAGAFAGALVCLHPLPSFIGARVMGDDFYGALAFGALLAWDRAFGHECADGNEAVRRSDRQDVGDPLGRKGGTYASAPAWRPAGPPDLPSVGAATASSRAWARIDGVRAAWAAVAGALMAALMLTRSNGILVLAAAALVWIYTLARGRGLAARATLNSHGAPAPAPERKSMAPLLITLLLVVSLGPPLAWSVRSSRLEGRPVFVHSLTAYNYWLGEGMARSGEAGSLQEGLWGQLQRRTQEMGGVSGEAWYWTLEPGDVAALETRLTAAALADIRARPQAFAGRWATGLGYFWFRAQTRMRSLEYLALMLPVLLLAALGVYSLLVRPGPADSLAAAALLTILLHNVSYAAIVPMARMSVQVFPAAAYLAGAGLVVVMSFLRGRPLT